MNVRQSAVPTVVFGDGLNYCCWRPFYKSDSVQQMKGGYYFIALNIRKETGTYVCLCV